jgi:O-antigen/teichoic acid export membrane protein
LNWALNLRTILRSASATGIPVDFHHMMREWQAILAFGVPALLGGCIVAFSDWASTVLLTRQPHGFTELAVVSAANQWKSAILFIPSSLGVALLPILSNLKSEAHTDKFRKLAQRAILGTAVLGLLVAFSIALSAKLILAAYGRGFLDGQIAFSIIVCASALIAVNNQSSKVLAGMDQMWLNTAFDTIWAVTYLLLALTFVPRFHSYGLAISLLMSVALQSMCQLYYLRTKGLRVLHVHNSY